MSSTLTVYFLTRRNGRFGSSTAGGASPNVGGALPKSVAAGACACVCCGIGGGAQVCSVVYPCVGGGVLIHCGCAGTLTSGAVPYPVIFPSRQPQSPLLFLYHVSKLRYLR